MRFINIAAFLALVASTQAWVIPKGTTDGIYAVAVGDDGVEVHTKIAEASSELPFNVSDANPLDRRGDGRIWCGCGFNLNPGNCDAAVADLKSQLGTWSPPHLYIHTAC